MNSILNQSTEVKDGRLVITQQTEQILSRSQIIDQLMMGRRRKEDLVNQSKQIKERYDIECTAETEFLKLLELLPEEEPLNL